MKQKVSYILTEYHPYLVNDGPNSHYNYLVKL